MASDPADVDLLGVIAVVIVSRDPPLNFKGVDAIVLESAFATKVRSVGWVKSPVT